MSPRVQRVYQGIHTALQLIESPLAHDLQLCDTAQRAVNGVDAGNPRKPRLKFSS